jgi:hypothetical protein
MNGAADVLAVFASVLVALGVLGFTITGRLVYRVSRDLAQVMQRLAYLEGKRPYSPPGREQP